MIFSRYRLIVMLVALLPLAGCGQSGDGFKGQHGKVSGKVTLDHRPIPEGSVVLFQAAKGGYTATGKTAADGSFHLQSNQSDELPAVKYLVQVSPPATGASTTPQDPAKMTNLVNPKQKKPADNGPIPNKYVSTTTSQLEFTVTAGKNSADFDLKK